jgi:hypothetical protein
MDVKFSHPPKIHNNHHNKGEVFKFLKPIRLVVVMSVVNLWKAR